MGIAIAALEHLLLLKAKYPQVMSGNILQLGRQDIYFNIQTLKEFECNFNVVSHTNNITTLTNPWTKEEVIDDITLFSRLGFDSVESLDFVGNEDPTYVHDLNCLIDSNLKQKFTTIYDSGTCEHVFSTANFFENIHEMLMPGGVVIHENPTNNWVDHGFWQISPTAFADCYATNGYRILEAYVCLWAGDASIHLAPTARYQYNPGVLDSVSTGGFPAGMCTTFFVAQKSQIHSKFKIPVQGFYKKHWSV